MSRRQHNITFAPYMILYLIRYDDSRTRMRFLSLKAHLYRQRPHKTESKTINLQALINLEALSYENVNKKSSNGSDGWIL